MQVTSDSSIVDSAQSEDLVIFVHGTFAGDRDRRDNGERWWQRDSDVWQWVESHLPKGVTLPDESVNLFHWSGDNSQSARLAASTCLLAWLIELERQKRGYHLVGHSHGGSVIWEALITSEVTRRSQHVSPDLLRELVTRKLVRQRGSRRKSVPGILAYPQISSQIKLDGLRSWITIGTPFLHHLPSRRWLVNGWPDPNFSLAPLVRRGWSDLAQVAAMLATVLSVIFSGLGLASSYDRSSLIPWVVWLSVSSALMLALFWLHPRRRLGHVLIIREHASHRVIKRFARRWLGLWAPSDEAISALASLTNPSSFDYSWLCSPLEERDQRQPPAAITDSVALPLRLSSKANSLNLVPEVAEFAPVRRFVRLASFPFNRWIAPRATKSIAEIVLRSGQGCDIRGAVLAYASPWPLPLRQPITGLPAETAARLDDGANRQAARVGPVIREILGSALMEGTPLPQLATPDRLGIDARALVHTSYFHDIDVLQLIVLHITQNTV